MTNETDIDRRRLLQSGVAALAAHLVAHDAIAQDAVQTEPGNYRLVLENSRVRVLEFVSRPRTVVCGVGKHSHPAHLTVALSDARVRITLPNGEVVEAGNKPGDVFWSEAETHTVENVGGGVIRALIIEIKDAPGRPA
jgi:hypothetical protein